MEKAVTPGPAKTFWQDMEHEQIKKIFSGDCSGLILFGFGIEIPEGDHAVFGFDYVFFLDNAFVKISAKID